MTPEAVLALVTAIAGGTPPLPGARCINLAPAFDGDRDVTDPALPLSVCERCPVQSRCREWAHAETGVLRPHGVVGGEILKWQRSSSLRPRAGVAT
jgi:hypothetical protein